MLNVLILNVLILNVLMVNNYEFRQILKSSNPQTLKSLSLANQQLPYYPIIPLFNGYQVQPGGIIVRADIQGAGIVCGNGLNDLSVEIQDSDFRVIEINIAVREINADCSVKHGYFRVLRLLRRGILDSLKPFAVRG